MNPEVMLLHRPFHHFSNVHGSEMLSHVVDHCQNRGLGLLPATVFQRRPRTVFYIPETDAQATFGAHSLQVVGSVVGGQRVFWQIDPERKTVYEVKAWEIKDGFKPHDCGGRGQRDGV